MIFKEKDPAEVEAALKALVSQFISAKPMSVIYRQQQQQQQQRPISFV